MEKITLILFAISLFSLAFCVEENFKIISTEYGPIRGQLQSTIIDQKPYYSFRGIPYAQAPIAELRFKVALLPVPWTETRDALNFGNECVQKSFITGRVFGEEDCLFLNVFVPATIPKEKLPVMVFIHGGGYAFGSGNGYGPDLLLNNDVILVTLNYRLGPFGFLSLDTPEYSGNMGLKDQLAALKWVNQNIENFGGDSQKITIFGESAGSASTEFHTIVPASEGLFQRAIFESGSVLNPWAIGTSHVDDMYAFGKQFGSNLRSIDEIIAFLNAVDPNLLVTGTVENLFALHPSVRHVKLTWAPVIEVPNAVEPFLLSSPMELLLTKSNQSIDILTGFNSAETYFLSIPEYTMPALLQAVDLNLGLTMPWKDWQYSYASEEYKLAANEIRNYYIPGGKINMETFYEYNQMLSDTIFGYGIQTSAYLQAQRTAGKVYNYLFDLDSRLNLFKSALGRVEINSMGASHADELFYLFFQSFEDFKFPELYMSLTEESVELKGIRLMTKLWTNFAKFGTVSTAGDVVEILPITNNQKNFFTITNDGLVRGINPIADKIKFWNYLYQKFVSKDMELQSENIKAVPYASETVETNEKKKSEKQNKVEENVDTTEENSKSSAKVDKKKQKKNKNKVTPEDGQENSEQVSQTTDKNKQKKGKSKVKETENVDGGQEVNAEENVKTEKNKQKKGKNKVKETGKVDEAQEGNAEENVKAEKNKQKKGKNEAEQNAEGQENTKSNKKNKQKASKNKSGKSKSKKEEL